VANLGTKLLLPTVSELDGWKYCPRCRAEVEIGEGKAECPSCGFLSYASSKPTASALCIDDEDRVLLSRRGVEPFKGLWDVPGGFLDEGEHPLDCLHRELREEAGVAVEPHDFLGVWIDRYGSDDPAPATLNFYWTVRIVEGDPEPDDDVAELRWFAAGEIPHDELAFGHLGEVLRARHEHA
jgi:ADP-ribose pyrophosphatase YjhB (NUDIX family)